MSRLQVSNATVRYGEAVALDACSLTIEAGELVVVLGPSGCGKSTLLRAIAGLVPLDSGSISIDDRDVTALAPAARDVAMVFQGYALFPHLDVAGNIGFGMRARKVPAAEIASAVREIARTLGIEGLLERRPHEISGGERQRAALARALVRAPRLALLDEPLANLDAPLRVAARGEIARLQRDRRTTMLHVTHDQAEAMALGDRIAVMRAGQVVQIGSPTEIYDHPADTFVARFVGNPPMNIVAADAWSASGPAVWRGFRAEDTDLVPCVDAVADGLPARIDRVERMGDHVVVALAPDAAVDRLGEILVRAPRDIGFVAGDHVIARPRRSTSFDREGIRIAG